MSNRLAIVLGILIVGAIIADFVFDGGDRVLFLMKEFSRLVEWLAFWR